MAGIRLNIRDTEAYLNFISIYCISRRMIVSISMAQKRVHHSVISCRKVVKIVRTLRATFLHWKTTQLYTLF